MIPRLSGREKPADAPPPELKVVEVTDLDFSFGPGDSYTYTLGEGDTILHSESHYILDFVDGEHVEIEKSKVRLFARRKRKTAISVKPYEPGLIV